MITTKLALPAITAINHPSNTHILPSEILPSGHLKHVMESVEIEPWGHCMHVFVSLSDILPWPHWIHFGF
jgi:hypothetical protein